MRIILGARRPGRLRGPEDVQGDFMGTQTSSRTPLTLRTRPTWNDIMEKCRFSVGSTSETLTQRRTGISRCISCHGECGSLRSVCPLCRASPGGMTGGLAAITGRSRFAFCPDPRRDCTTRNITRH